MSEHQRMIRKGSHKLILYPEAKVARVFDLARDPHEMNDLADTAGGKVILAKPLHPLEQQARSAALLVRKDRGQAKGT